MAEMVEGTAMPEQRRYTIDEIDQMREDIRWTFPGGVSYDPLARSAETEQRLRTYMLAGIDPEEVRRKRNEAIQREQESMILHQALAQQKG